MGNKKGECGYWRRVRETEGSVLRNAGDEHLLCISHSWGIREAVRFIWPWSQCSHCRRPPAQMPHFETVPQWIPGQHSSALASPIQPWKPPAGNLHRLPGVEKWTRQFLQMPSMYWEILLHCVNLNHYKGNCLSLSFHKTKFLLTSIRILWCVNLTVEVSSRIELNFEPKSSVFSCVVVREEKQRHRCIGAMKHDHCKITGWNAHYRSRLEQRIISKGKRNGLDM